MSIKKSIFKIFNGTSWDEYYHKTSADQVVYTKPDGTASNVQAELAAQNSAMTKWESKYATLSYKSATLMEGQVHCAGNVNTAVATIRAIDGTPYSAVKIICLKPAFGGDPTRIQIYAYGTGFVSGHVLGVDLIVHHK